LLTRMVAIVPAVVVTILYGEQGVGQLLVLSQVVLSMQLAFAVVPLVTFTSDRRKMGRFANGPALTILAWIVTIVIVSLNGYLLVKVVFGSPLMF
jgi:manganese transport protein